MQISRQAALLCIVIIIPLGFSGCASTGGGPPTCPQASGLRCARIDQIDTQIDSTEHAAMRQPTYPHTRPLASEASSPRQSGVKAPLPCKIGAHRLSIWIPPSKMIVKNLSPSQGVTVMVKLGKCSHTISVRRGSPACRIGT